MSSVRMCDRCNTVFSELADGWQTFSATTMKLDPESGRREQVNVYMDACPDCAMTPDQKPPKDVLEQKILEARISKLENETGVGKATE